MGTDIPYVVEDCFGLLKLYSDGTIYRASHIPCRNPVRDESSVEWKDLLFDEKKNLQLRLYKPASPSATKLPIIYYIFGGGFCLGSRTLANFHNCCLRLASGLQAVVLSPDYRQAPEHRLPAAVDDALSFLRWLQGQTSSCENRDTWFGGNVDFDQVFIFGDSSGGNIAHNLAVRLGPGSFELAPVRVRGYVLLAPFFGGTVRTKSEVERPCEGFWTLDSYDRFWRLSVPIGSTIDHPLVNPFGPASPSLAEVAMDPILVVVGGDEILKDRAEDYARRLKELGKMIEYAEFEGKEHGFFTDNSFSEEAEEVIQVLKRFMSENSNSSN